MKLEVSSCSWRSVYSSQCLASASLTGEHTRLMHAPELTTCVSGWGWNLHFKQVPRAAVASLWGNCYFGTPHRKPRKVLWFQNTSSYHLWHPGRNWKSAWTWTHSSDPQLRGMGLSPKKKKEHLRWMPTHGPWYQLETSTGQMEPESPVGHITYKEARHHSSFIFTLYLQGAKNWLVFPSFSCPGWFKIT